MRDCQEAPTAVSREIGAMGWLHTTFKGINERDMRDEDEKIAYKGFQKRQPVALVYVCLSDTRHRFDSKRLIHVSYLFKAQGYVYCSCCFRQRMLLYECSQAMLIDTKLSIYHISHGRHNNIAQAMLHLKKSAMLECHLGYHRRNYTIIQSSRPIPFIAKREANRIDCQGVDWLY